MVMWLKERKKFWRPICRKSKRYVFAGILILCGILAGCQKDSRKAIKKDAVKENSGWKPLEITKFEKQRVEKQVKNVLSAYQGIFPYRKQKPIAPKDQRKVLKKLWDKGYPAADSEEKVVMKCGQTVRDFYRKTQKKEKGTMTIVSMNPSGGFSLIQLESEQERLLGVLATVVWNTNGEASISELVKYQVKKFQISEDGYLICEFYLSDQDELQAGGTMKFCLEADS